MPPRSVLLNLGLPNVFTAGKPRTEDVVNEVKLQVQSEEETGRAIVGDGKPEGRDRSHGKHDSMHSSSGDILISALSYGTPTPSSNASPIDAISPLVLSNPTVDFTASANLAESNHFPASSSVALSSKIPRPARACDNCGFAPTTSYVTLKQCSRCKMALYCSAKCQKNNWSAHKKTCTQPRGSISDQGNAANSPSCADQEKDCEIFTDFSGSSTPISPSEDGMTSTAATSPGLYFDYKTELLNSPSDSHAYASIPPA